jgi:hypothetical protein
MGCSAGVDGGQYADLSFDGLCPGEAEVFPVHRSDQLHSLRQSAQDPARYGHRWQPDEAGRGAQPHRARDSLVSALAAGFEVWLDRRLGEHRPEEQVVLVKEVGLVPLEAQADACQPQVLGELDGLGPLH